MERYRSWPLRQTCLRFLGTKLACLSRTEEFDRMEVDMRLGDLLVEAKLAESDFQTAEKPASWSIRDLSSAMPELLRR